MIEAIVPLQRTNPRLKTPAGLESPASRGPYRLHAPLDNACVGLDAEDLRVDFGRFDHDLRDDMAALSLAELAKRHPELTFETVRTTEKRQPKGFDYVVDLRGGKVWRCARWRRAA